jgi:ABC-2 type transport system permease protein
MSAIPAPTRIRRLPPWTEQLKVTQRQVIVSEWTKFRSLRSTRWSMGVALLLTIALPMIGAVITDTHWAHMSASDRAGRHPLDIALFGARLGQLAIGVLGVLMISSEYSTGMIRASLGAVPKRLPVLWGKVGVFGFVTFLLMLPAVLIAFFGSQAILNDHDHILQISFSHGGVARSVVGAALYLTVVGVFAFSMGAITRNTAGGIAAFAGIFFVIPPLMNVLPTNWNNAISKYLPSNAGADVFSLTHGPNDLGPWTGFGVFCAYTAVAAAIAAILLVRRDA